MKKLNKTVLLAAVLASAANAGVNVTGDATVGLKYVTKSSTPANENSFVVSSGNNDSGQTHLNFAATNGGKGGNGVYAFVGTNVDITAGTDTTLTVDQAYVGYKANKYDTRMGTLDTLTYAWVGSLNEQQYFASNIATTALYMKSNGNSAQATTKLGTVTLGAGFNLPSSSYDYTSYDLGAKFNVGKLALAVVYQKVNDAVATNNYDKRNTTSAGLNYALKNLSSAKVLKDLVFTGTYSNSSDSTTASGAGKQSDKSTYSLGLKMNNASVMYQTGTSDGQDQWNIEYLRPLSKNASFGVTGQLASNYYGATTGTTSSSQTVADEFAAVFLTTTF
ncbi:MAG: porin [Gammaproteobacteria bacterium]|nr:porin [Gammaproteobacteria bacterium]